jgi:predicted 2-oxoglutarate/Fe(II)-dependent dioxygenase YbiX
MNNINSESKLKDFIYVFDNILSQESCDLIIKEYEKSNWEDAHVSNNVLNPDVRNCKIINISSENSIKDNREIRKSLDDIIFNSLVTVINNLSNELKNLRIKNDSGYDLLKYTEGGLYKEHTDISSVYNRSISCSFCLNDDYEGGEFSFFNNEIKYNLKKGSVIAFPSNYLFPHQILPIKKGTRYSIITWLY